MTEPLAAVIQGVRDRKHASLCVELAPPRLYSPAKATTKLMDLLYIS